MAGTPPPTYTGTRSQNGSGIIFSIGAVAATVAAASDTTYVMLGELKSIEADGGTRNILDATNMQSTGKEKQGGLLDFGKVSITLNRLSIGSDAGQTALLAASYAISGQPINFSIQLPKNPAASTPQTTKGDVEYFAAIVSTGAKVTYKPDSILEISFTLEKSNGPTYVAGS